MTGSTRKETYISSRIFLKWFLCLVMWLPNFQAIGQVKTDETTACNYTGTIGQYQIKMILFFSDKAISGRYAYSKRGNTFDLQGNAEGKYFTLKESFDKFLPDSDDYTNVISGYFDLHQEENGNLTGIWRKTTSKAKSLPVSLSRTYKAQYTDSEADAFFLNHNKKIKLDTVLTEYINEVQFIYPDKDKEESLKRINSCLKNARLDYIKENHELDLSKLPKRLVNETEHAMDSMLKTFKKDDDLDDWQSWWFDSSSTVVYMDEHILSVCHGNNMYSGGAHPNSFMRYANYNTLTGGSVTLKNIFIPGYSAYLNHTGEKAFRKQNNVPVGKSLNDAGFFWDKDTFYAVTNDSTNYYFGVNGIHFFYNTYEIASYVDGMKEFYISYADLKPIINPSGPLAWVLKEY